MRNSVFPSLSSPFYSIGNNEIQMPSSSVSIELERMNSYNSGFTFYPQLSNDVQLGNLAPFSSIEIPQPLDYLSGDGLASNSMYHQNNTSHATMSTRIARDECATENARLQTITDDPRNKEPTMKASKKRKAPYTQDHHYQPSEELWTSQKLKATEKRSQKIGDKITALQQLVSPYGKTDTASVLQEAALYIKQKQQQIQAFTTPFFGCWHPHHTQACVEEKRDLCSRGLCLVPLSSIIDLP